MKTPKELADLIQEHGDIQDPKLVTIIPQVRTGTSYPLPPWFTPRPCSEPSHG